MRLYVPDALQMDNSCTLHLCGGLTNFLQLIKHNFDYVKILACLPNKNFPLTCNSPQVRTPRFYLSEYPRDFLMMHRNVLLRRYKQATLL